MSRLPDALDATELEQIMARMLQPMEGASWLPRLVQIHALLYANRLTHTELRRVLSSAQQRRSRSNRVLPSLVPDASDPCQRRPATCGGLAGGQV